MQPRTGKTFPAAVWASRQEPKVLILCPKSVIGVWESWMEPLIGLENMVSITGSKVKKQHALLKEAHVYITNFETIRAVGLLQYKWKAIIVDESILISNYTCQVGGAFYLQGRDPNQKRVILSGAPATESYMQYVNQMKWVFGDFLGYERLQDYIEENWYPDESGRKMMCSPDHKKEISNEVQSRAFCLTQEQAGIKGEVMYQCAPYNIQSKVLLSEMERILEEELRYKTRSGVTRIANPMDRAGFLHRLSVGIGIDGTLLSKEHIEQVCQYIEDEGYRKIVILTNYKIENEAICVALDDRGRRTRSITGATPLRERDFTIREFRAFNDIICICQVKTVKMGLDFSSSEAILYSSVPWSGDDRYQADQRGQNLNNEGGSHVVDICPRFRVGQKDIRFSEFVRKTVMDKVDMSSKVLEGWEDFDLLKYI